MIVCFKKALHLSNIIDPVEPTSKKKKKKSKFLLPSFPEKSSVKSGHDLHTPVSCQYGGMVDITGKHCFVHCCID